MPCAAEDEKREQGRESWLAQVLGLIQLLCRGGRIISEGSASYASTPVTWPATDRLLLLNKHGCQGVMKQRLMGRLLYLP